MPSRTRRLRSLHLPIWPARRHGMERSGRRHVSGRDRSPPAGKVQCAAWAGLRRGRRTDGRIIECALCADPDEQNAGSRAGLARSGLREYRALHRGRDGWLRLTASGRRPSPQPYSAPARDGLSRPPRHHRRCRPPHLARPNSWHLPTPASRRSRRRSTRRRTPGRPRARCDDEWGHQQKDGLRSAFCDLWWGQDRASGNVTVNRAPPSWALLAMSMLPECSATRSVAMARPRALLRWSIERPTVSRSTSD